MTPYTSKEEEIREEILKEIDFLCDNWVEGDDKSPYRFGGWREEVGDTLLKIYTTKLSEAIAEERKKVRGIVEKLIKKKGYAVDVLNSDAEQIYGGVYNKAIEDVLSHLTQE